MTHLSASELKQHPSILSCMPLAQPHAPLCRAKPCRVMFFSRSLRENEPKEGCYPQGPLHRGMQLPPREDRSPARFLRPVGSKRRKASSVGMARIACALRASHAAMGRGAPYERGLPTKDIGMSTCLQKQKR